MLRALASAHPGDGQQLFAADGELNRYVNVYLNDEDVRVLDGLDTAVADGDTVVILPAMAGGALAAGERERLVRGEGRLRRAVVEVEARRVAERAEPLARAAGRASRTSRRPGGPTACGSPGRG